MALTLEQTQKLLEAIATMPASLTNDPQVNYEVDRLVEREVMIEDEPLPEWALASEELKRIYLIEISELEELMQPPTEVQK